ncbi:alpha/beta fold hydrolase [Streptomyces thermoviolaceus]|uniref:Alpha/beta fold hydrolase n=1 Tax=Streptomyces thermoviolaceus subsp. thermoviolaceus TaxID=66860 RepID=A0ABX0YUD8_STRTL|nr:MULTISPECIES: alpha/beta fold hydrolase [Streptomyces]MCM3263797.1 alpha/beta fold hydrolase [Streptomyces thermoviolaceus]NJP14716.1 alpha/beta fold hydrolase [Streptomyces thermoviolaceus subsp. thermoviolaceus]RSS07465.1 alpha/beta fold hydrolase [Streptomyces sp. WAC00469]WTD47741.1 alpha/beta fold hydrolase [Streptomyces thermoviolaceus]GGV75049.1 alpha/beta hydrolase [Streptomyces thermoviolaceus subsp. apingens]
MVVLATPGRTARLGRTAGPRPAVVRGAVLLLPGGPEASARRPSPLRAAALLGTLGRRLALAGRADGLAVHVVHYRCRGWNGDRADPARDAAWAVEEAVRRYGDVPVCLAGHGMGGRAALRAGGHEAVRSVVAVAPWLPEEGTAADPEPVKQLTGRYVLIVHGTRDLRTDPELSFSFAARAKKANRNVCRFEVHTDGHGLREYRAEVTALTANFVRATLFGHEFARPVRDALAAPPPIGLRMPLASGFGRPPRRR